MTIQRARQFIDHLAPHRVAGGDRLDQPYVSAESPIIVGGSPRSGTTLFRVILDSHMNVCCGPETGVFVLPHLALAELGHKMSMETDYLDVVHRRSKSRAEFIDRIFRRYAANAGKPRWSEKTPDNILHLHYIFRVFPKARFIHVIRDGRDVVCSLRSHPRHTVVDGKLVPTHTLNPIDMCIRRWQQAIEASRSFRSDARYMEVRYEDLVLDPVNTLEQVFEFLDEPWDTSILNFHEVHSSSRDYLKFPQNPEATKPLYRNAVGRWKQDLSAEDLACVEGSISPLLAELGYDPGVECS